MRKLFWLAVLASVLGSDMSVPPAHAGPITPADMALFDASPQDTHDAAVAMRAAGFTSLKQIATQGIGENVVQYLRDGSFTPPYTNKTALWTIMGDPTLPTPYSDGYGVIGDFQPEGKENSLYDKVSAVAVPTGVAAFPGGILGTLSGVTHTNVRASLEAVFAALNGKSAWSATDPDLLSWITNMAVGGDTNVRNYIRYASPAYVSNTAALQSVMGTDWKGGGADIGIIGGYAPGVSAEQTSLYHQLTFDTKPTWNAIGTVATQTALFGDLDGVDTGNIKTKMKDLLEVLGAAAYTDGSSHCALDITTAIGDAIGGDYRLDTNYTGILGRITSTTGVFGDLGYNGTSVYANINAVGVGNSLFGDLGSSGSAATRAGNIKTALGNTTFDASIYASIMDDTSPTGTGTPAEDAFSGIIGAINPASDNIVNALISVFTRLDTIAGWADIATHLSRGSGQSLYDWLNDATKWAEGQT